MSWDALVGIVEKFQTLIAGVLAIGAAVIAYLGAIRQARAVVEAERQRAVEQRRAVAAALWAELDNLALRLFADSQRLVSTPVRDGRLLGLSPLDLSVFTADPSAVGSLPSDEALMVTQVYKLIIDLNRRYARVGASAGIDENVVRSLGEQVGVIVGQIQTTLRGLRETAGIPEDKAAAAMAPWTPVLRS
jgi:hypothetical protein